MLTFQVEPILSGEGTCTVTFQEFDPATETFRLQRSLHEAPAESVAV
ncbi:hypothetical protein [Kitasatospora azatica]|nr:hypothetical protein [Kitasatospora azatica]